MSVTKHGVKGYEYQYKVTVLVGLSQCYSPNEKLFVETKGSEDAQIVNETNGVSTITEIQVKREKGSLTIEKLTDWLCHFQEHKGDNNLLHRILNEDNTMVLFITQSRCSDDTVTLKADFEKIGKHDEITLSKVKITESLKNKFFGSTKLMKAREQFCLEQSSTLGDKGGFESAFKKVLIWEEISDERVDQEVANLLNQKYHIAPSRTNDVYHNLLEVVKKGRDTSGDILLSFRNVISKNKIGRPQVDASYKSRAEEEGLQSILEKDGVLLLTGVSLCGKSEIAKKIASNFYEDGYDYMMYSPNTGQQKSYPKV